MSLISIPSWPTPTLHPSFPGLPGTSPVSGKLLPHNFRWYPVRDQSLPSLNISYTVPSPSITSLAFHYSVTVNSKCNVSGVRPVRSLVFVPTYGLGWSEG